MTEHSAQRANPRLVDFDRRPRIYELFRERPSHGTLAIVWDYAQSLEVDIARLQERVDGTQRGQYVRDWCEFGRDVIMLIIGGLLGLGRELSQQSASVSILGVVVIVLLVFLWFALWRIAHPVGGRDGQGQASAVESLPRRGA